jgi:hypothetical protein
MQEGIEMWQNGDFNMMRQEILNDTSRKITITKRNQSTQYSFIVHNIGETSEETTDYQEVEI